MTRVYVGDLDEGCSKRELEREMDQFCPLRDVWVARNPPGFAFVVFENGRDAEKAISRLNNRHLCGSKSRVRVEIARGPTRGGGGGGGRSRSYRSDGMKCYECGRPGHVARHCTRGPRDYRRSRSRSPRRRSRSRSPSPRGRRPRSESRSRSRSPSRDSKQGRSDSENEAQQQQPPRRNSEKSAEYSDQEQSKDGDDAASDDQDERESRDAASDEEDD